MKNDEERVIRNYDVSLSMHEWLKKKSKEEYRPIIKQVEVILEQARDNDINQG